MANLLLSVLGIVGIAAFLGITILRLLRFLHMLQLEGYRSGRFLKWLIHNRSRIFAIRPIKEAKKKLVFTARATRLFVWTAGLLAFGVYSLSRLSLFSLVCGTFLIAFLTPGLLILANLLIYPLETGINHLYLRSAKKKLNKMRPQVIAITGSYGKTSTKDFLASILSERYRVLKTPGSFNTPMGICKIIRGELAPEHRIFIVEMGARQKGDIRELCEIVRPDIGLLTAIGPQHLEMFKTIENIMAAKYELIESLSRNGVAIFNNDDAQCRILADRTSDKKVLRYGMDQNRGPLYLMARDVSTASQGIHFWVRNSKGGANPFSCRLLGRHNVYNILAAATVASELGMSLDEIAAGVRKLEAPPHRLQLIQASRGITIIDDAFNSNPLGAKIALEVLGEVQGERKVLVTPGLVELGDREYEENKQIGIAAAKVCDLIFLIGPKRTKPIREGLEESGFPAAHIYVERSLKEATEKFGKILRPGDIVLFENDLPDTYNE